MITLQDLHVSAVNVQMWELQWTVLHYPGLNVCWYNALTIWSIQLETWGGAKYILIAANQDVEGFNNLTIRQQSLCKNQK